MKKKLIIGGMVILILLIAGGFGVWKIVSTAGKAPAVTMPTVKVERGDVEKTIFAKGLIAQVQRQEVTPEARAKVTRIAVKVGDRVKAGDLLFAMDEGDASLAARHEELTLQSKADNFARAQDAVNTNIIRTPVTGKVVKLFVKDGDKIDQDSLVAEIADPSTLDVSGAFAPIGIDKVAIGQKVKVFLDNWTDFYGTVTKVDKQGRPDIGGGISHDITVHLNNPGAVATGRVNSIVLTLPDGSEICSVAGGEVNDAGLIKIKAGATGTVLKTEVKQGENVSKNTILARLDITTGLNDLKDRRTALQQALLAKEMKTRELSKYRVYAGMDGVVTEINVVLGQEPPVDKPAVVISGTAGLELKAKVEEGDMPFVYVGQEATVYASAFEDRGFPGVITEIAGQGKTEGRIVVFETKIHLKDPGPLKAGMNGNADITVARKKNVLRVPIQAVTIDGIKGVVLIQGQGGPKPKEIKLGLEGDEFLEIKEGLKPGDKVLINPRVQQPMGF